MKAQAAKPASTGNAGCDWHDPVTGECCDQGGPFGFGPPRMITTITACATHREWAEAIFRERKDG